MRLRAKDTVHISAVQAENLVEGDEFELNDHDGQKLIDRGIAEPADGPPKAEKPAAATKAPKAAKQNKGTVQTEKKD